MANIAEIAHGPMLIGTLLNVLLFGVMIAQVYIYYTSYRRDRLFLKLYVFAVFVADTVNSVFDVGYIYMCLIVHFGDDDYLKVINWQFPSVAVLTGIIALMVQIFFAWRIHMLTRNWFLVAVVSILALASAICAAVTTWFVTVIPEFDRFQEFQGFPIGWLSCAAAADIVITTILVWHLRRHKTGFKKSDAMIDRIIRLTVQTGLITSVVAIVDLSLYLSTSSGIHLLLNFALCKLYSNSFMSSLNARSRLRHTPQGQSTLDNVFGEGHISSISRDNPTGGWHDRDVTISGRAGEKPQTIQLDSMVPPKAGVFVHVESHEMRDIGSHGNDNKAQNKKHVIPAGTNYGAQGQTKEPSFSSLSDTGDHKNSMV